MKNGNWFRNMRIPLMIIGGIIFFMIIIVGIKDKSSNTSSLIQTLSLSEDNFVKLNTDWLPGDTRGVFVLDYKIVETDVSNLGLYQGYCKVYDNGQEIKGDSQKMVAVIPAEGNADPGRFSFWVFLDKRKSHRIVSCCQIDTTRVSQYDNLVFSYDGKNSYVKRGELYGTVSNEVCLPEVIVAPARSSN